MNPVSEINSAVVVRQWGRRAYRFTPEQMKKRAATRLRYYYRNQRAEQARARDRYSKNPQKFRQYSAEYAKTHRKEISEYGAKYFPKYAKENPDVMRRIKQRRRAKKKNLLHPNHDTNLELRLHAEAICLTQTTGVLHEVDHLIPIACGGWHHHLNLQVLPKRINTAKGSNPFREMPGYKSWRDVPEFLWPTSLVQEYRSLMIATPTTQ